MITHCDQVGCKIGQTLEIQPVQSTMLTDEEEKLHDHFKLCRKKDKV